MIGAPQREGVIRSRALAAAAFLIVGVVGTLLAALVMAYVDIDLGSPEVVRALVAWPLAVALLGVIVGVPDPNSSPAQRFWRSLGAGALVHPLAWIVFVLTVRWFPFAGIQPGAPILDDLSVAVVFSLGSLSYGIWLTAPAAFLAFSLAARLARQK